MEIYIPNLYSSPCTPFPSALFQAYSFLLLLTIIVHIGLLVLLILEEYIRNKKEPDLCLCSLIAIVYIELTTVAGGK